MMSNNNASKTTETDPASLQDFEAAVAELESIIAKMESGQLPLQESLSAYKRGSQLLGSCQKALAEVEQQIRILNESNQLQTFTPVDE